MYIQVYHISRQWYLYINKISRKIPNIRCPSVLACVPFITILTQQVHDITFLREIKKYYNTMLKGCNTTVVIYTVLNIITMCTLRLISSLLPAVKSKRTTPLGIKSSDHLVVLDTDAEDDAIKQRVCTQTNKKINQQQFNKSTSLYKFGPFCTGSSLVIFTNPAGKIPSLVPILPLSHSSFNFERMVMMSPVLKLSSPIPSPSKSNRASHVPVS